MKKKHSHKELVKKALRKRDKGASIMALILCLLCIIFLGWIQERGVLEKMTIDFSKMLFVLCEIAGSLVLEMMSH